MTSLLILLFLFPSVSSFFGCGCYPPPPPLPCFQPIQLPQLCLPQIPLCPPPSCCGRKKRETVGQGMVTSTRRPLITYTPINSTITQSLCNSIQLKTLMDAIIVVPSSTPQLSIHSAIRAKLRGDWVVLCIDKQDSARLSFISDFTTFCSSNNDKVTCYAFQI